MMSVMVIACYRPKPGKEEVLLELMKIHLPTLRDEGLVGDGPSLCGRAKDGTIIEVFTWKSQAAIDAAHENPVVGAMWERYAKVCDFTPVGEVEEAKQLFSPLTPVDLS
jgi:quinol monooxygenase YgiN